MAVSTTLFRIVSELTHNELRDLFRKMSFIITSPRGTDLRTRCYNSIQMDDDCCIFSIEYQEEEGPFTIGDQNQFFAVSRYTKIALIGAENLLVFNNKNISNNIVNKINDYLFDRTQVIFDHPFSEQFMQDFIARNPHVTGNAFMGELTIPGANNAAIYGPDVEDSEMYRHALDYGGQHKYICIRLTQLRKTIGISRKGSVVFFSGFSDEEIIHFIRQYILR